MAGSLSLRLGLVSGPQTTLRSSSLQSKLPYAAMLAFRGQEPGGGIHDLLPGQGVLAVLPGLNGTLFGQPGLESGVPGSGLRLGFGLAGCLAPLHRGFWGGALGLGGHS